MRCSEVMKTKVVTTRETDTVQKCAQLMRDHNIGFMAVVDQEGRAVGTLTDRDITVRCVADDVQASTCRIGEVMTHEVIACRPQDEIELVEDLMKRYRKSRILVLDDDDFLKGVISLSDLADKVSPEVSGAALRQVASREVRPS